MAELNQRIEHEARLVTAPVEEARWWTQESLRQGFDISAAVLNRGVLGGGRYMAIVSEQFQRTAFGFAQGGVIGQHNARALLATVLRELGETSARAVLVEDSVRNRSDPAMSMKGEPSAIIGEHVLHWSDLADGGTKAMEVVAWGATGYPTNAFIVSKVAADFGLIDGREAPNDVAREVVSSLLGVVVAAFDAESFLLWVGDAFSDSVPSGR